ncbi:hypothetical protein Lumi_067 [Xylophilus phage Lumi]|nr:hypothetical protein Lumi_067 [Xylophilus phage Lumi]
MSISLAPISDGLPFQGQKLCKDCRHSSKGLSGITVCNQTVDPITGQGLNYASTWRLAGMDHQQAERHAEVLGVCGPQGRLWVQTDFIIPRKKHWWSVPKG